MARYAAFLRGVMPTNARMPELKRAFEKAGFGEVRTVLASGNVVFDAPAGSEVALQRRAEQAMEEHLGRTFLTIVRAAGSLEELLAADPFATLHLPPEAKRIVTFLRTRPKQLPALPIERDGARIFHLSGREAFTTYLPTPRGPVFMSLIEETFGKDLTTRTWDTLKRVAR